MTTRASHLRHLVSALTLPALSIALVGCAEHPTAADDTERVELATASARGAAGNMGSSQVWRQGFTHGTTGWYGMETPGALGWCGSIERVARGDGAVAPSAGRAYATVSFAGCNAFWSGFGIPGSAPWAPGPDFGAFSQSASPAGTVNQVDIHLDPEAAAAGDEIFTIAASIRELASPANAFGTFRYFFVPVVSTPGGADVMGFEVTDAGWYTFRFRYGADDAALTATFELTRQGRVLAARELPIAVNLGPPEELVATSSLAATEWANGYLWFVSIAPGLELPIDEHMVRPGR